MNIIEANFLHKKITFENYTIEMNSEKAALEKKIDEVKKSNTDLKEKSFEIGKSDENNGKLEIKIKESEAILDEMIKKQKETQQKLNELMCENDSLDFLNSEMEDGVAKLEIEINYINDKMSNEEKLLKEKISEKTSENELILAEYGMCLNSYLLF